MANVNSGQATTTGGGGSKSKAKSKGKILNLDDLCSHINWAEEMENEAVNVGGVPTTTTVEIKTKVTHARMSLPSGPKASRGEVVIDMDKLPADPPYVAYMGNISYQANNDAIEDFFHGLKVVNIRMITEQGRPKGFCYIEFASRSDLAEALKLNNERLAGRPVKIDLADQERNKPQQSGGGNRRYMSGEGGAGQADAWRPPADNRGYGPPQVPRDRGPPPMPQDMPPHHYGTMPGSGRPPPGPSYNAYQRYSNDRPSYNNSRGSAGGYGPPPQQQPYGPGQQAPYYPPQSYGDPSRGSGPPPMDQQGYYQQQPSEFRDRRGKYEYSSGRYNTIGPRSQRERDPRYDAGYESERDYSDYQHQQNNQNYQQRYSSNRQQQQQQPHEYRQRGGGGGGGQQQNAGYPLYRQGSQGSYAGYSSDTENYRNKYPPPQDAYGRGSGNNYNPQYQQQYPPYQQHYKSYQEMESSGDGRRGSGAPPRQDYNTGGSGRNQQQPAPRREHRTSTTSTVSIDESLNDGKSGSDNKKERRRLQLAPRTKPVTELPAPIEKSSSGIFGEAKPVDTRRREQEIEEKIIREKEEIKKRSVSQSASETDIGQMQKAAAVRAQRKSSVNSARSSPVEDPKPSVTTPTTPAAPLAPEDFKFAPAAGAVTILRRRTTSSQNDTSETKPADDVVNVLPQPTVEKSIETASEEKIDNLTTYERSNERRGSKHHRGGGHRGGKHQAERGPRFQNVQDLERPPPQDRERRGSQDSLIFTRGGRGRVRGGGRRAFGGGGRGRSFDEGDTKAYQHLDPQGQQQQPQSGHRRVNQTRSSVERQNSEPRTAVDDDSQTGQQPPPAPHRKKSRDKQPVAPEKKPPLPASASDDPPSYTDVNKFSVLSVMSEDEE